MLLTSKSQPTERPADHEDSASSSSTPLKSANKLYRPPKVWRLTDEKLFSLNLNHEKPKAVDEAATKAETAADTVETKAATAVTKCNQNYRPKLKYTVLNFIISVIINSM